MDYINIGKDQEINENGIVFDVGSLYEHLERLSDKRNRRGKRYRLADMVLLVILAKLGGEDNPSGIADWIEYRKEELSELIGLRREETPCHMTIRRMLQEGIEPDELEGVMEEYHQSRLDEGTELVLSMDGKTVRGTIPTRANRGTHLLAVYVPEQGLVLVEAMAAGTPAVAVITTGSKDVLAQGGGILVPSEVGAFKKAALELLTKPDYHEAMSKRAQEIASTYTIEAATAKLELVYAEARERGYFPKKKRRLGIFSRS